MCWYEFLSPPERRVDGYYLVVVVQTFFSACEVLMDPVRIAIDNETNGVPAEIKVSSCIEIMCPLWC
jgi:hypothetical protein